MENRLTDLEIRLTHQDAAVEELTRVVMLQEKQIESLTSAVKQLKAQLKDVSASNLAAESDETAPPHY